MDEWDSAVGTTPRPSLGRSAMEDPQDVFVPHTYKEQVVDLGKFA